MARVKKNRNIILVNQAYWCLHVNNFAMQKNIGDSCPLEILILKDF